jgi:hypothetical protein
MKILHLTFHSGTINEIEYICKYFGHDVISQKFDDGETKSNAIYNIGFDRAKKAWDKYKDYYNSFDMIITSDTAPVARTFMQNGYKGKLIVWVCNRFDYADMASLDCRFPDEEFYDLFRKKADNIKIISYTPFEHWYAKNLRNVTSWTECIKPTGKLITNKLEQSSIPNNIIKKESFFVPPYHNDTIFINLSKKLNELGINNYCGRYNGSNDLIDFKGIIHIPYAWSNFALFENLQNELIYFIPSKNFLLTMAKEKNFFWSPPFVSEIIHLSEWYCSEFNDLFVYFDSWNDLVLKIKSLDYDKKKKIIKDKMKEHTNKTLGSWRKFFM